MARKPTAKQVENFDIGTKLGPLSTIPGSDWEHVRAPEAPGGLTWRGVPECPMHSFERPACKLWNALAKALYARGWSEKRIQAWLRSKEARWALDGSLGDQIEALGRSYADQIPDDWKA